MTSLTATDLQGEYQGKLNGHLKSEDFLELKISNSNFGYQKLN
jgi:hypothetical protein